MTTTMPSYSASDWNNAITLFSGVLQHEFQNVDLFGTDKSQFSSAPEGETYRYDVMQARRAINKADGENHAYQIADIDTNQLILDEPLKDWVYVRRDQLIVRPDLRLPENQALNLARSIAHAKHLRILGLLAAAATTAGNTHAIDVSAHQAAGTLGNAVRDMIEEVGAEMDTDGVPNIGRFGFWKSPLWYPLNGVQGVKSVDFGGQADNQTAGGVGKITDYANFMNYNSPLGFGTDLSASPFDAEMPSKYQTDLTNVVAVCWQRETWALRHASDLNVQVDWDTQFEAFKTRGAVIMGTATVQPVGIHVILDQSGA